MTASTPTPAADAILFKRLRQRAHPLAPWTG